MAGGLGLGRRGTLPIGLFYLGFIFLYHSTYSPFAKPIYRQLWDNFETNFKQPWGNFEETLRQFWDNSETILRQPWDSFGTILRQLGTSMRHFWDNFGITWRLSRLFWAYTYSRSCGGASTIQHYRLDCPLEMLFMFSTLRSPDFCLAYSKNSYFTSQKIWPSSYYSSFCSAGWQKLWHPGFRNGRKWSQGKIWKEKCHPQG